VSGMWRKPRKNGCDAIGGMIALTRYNIVSQKNLLLQPLDSARRESGSEKQGSPMLTVDVVIGLQDDSGQWTAVPGSSQVGLPRGYQEVLVCGSKDGHLCV
jgi:hypothetical protein